VNELIESIISQNIPQYEIIVCGTYADTSGYPVRYIEFNENDDKGWLTKKKNIVAANAIYENVCIFHDRIRLATGWYEGMKKFGDDWAVQYCGTFSPDGREKHNDAMVATAINGKYVGCNLDHNDWDPTMWIDGAQIIAKKALLLKCNLDEELFHCEGEDVEWCRRIQRAGFKIKFNPHSVLFNICEKKVTENFDRNTMTAIAYPSRYTDVFKLCLISASDCGGCKNRTIQEILQAEENLQKLGHEKLADLRAIRQAFYAEPLYVLWNGLSLEAQGYYRQASDEYRKAINLGFDHWRIKFYLARSEFTQARQFLAGLDGLSSTLQIKNTLTDLPKFGLNAEVKGKPRKIYCVLFDTMPLLDEIVSLAGENEMALLRQVGGCFTTTSCAEMLTGKFPSDLEKNGIGYDRHQCYRNGDESDVHWPWEKELIVNRLLEYGWKVKLHNGHYFSNILSNNPAFEKTTSLPGGLQAEKEFWNDKKAVVETILGDGPQSERFYQNEIRHIHQIQSEKPAKDKFYFVKYDQFHVANVEKSGKDVTVRRSIELMKQWWDFNEPDAMFWFFSDHGDWRTMGEHPEPDHYLSWVMFRDNTADAIEAKSRFIFAGDFFPTIMNKFGYRYESVSDARPVQQPQDTDRIYCTEDGRQRFDVNNSTTAIACRFTDWDKGRPSALEQVSYFKPRNEFVCLLAHLNANGFVTNTLRIDKIDECLKQALIDRFEWVNESPLLSQAGDTQWMKNMRICLDTPDIDKIGFDNCDPKTNGEYALIPYLVRPGDIVFDVGANKGTWSRNVLSTVSPVRIYSFEPVPDTFVVLKDNLGDSGASLHNVAISNSDGEKTFFYYNQSSQSAELSSFYRRSFSIEQRLRIKPIRVPVQTRTLDSFCKEHLISYIDFLKIDTEGAELDVLQGAVELLRERKIKTIQFEYGGTYPDAGITLRQVCQLLSSYGYTIFRILPDGLVHIGRWHDSLENNLYSNYLVVSPERINDYGPMKGFTDSKTGPDYKAKAETVPQTDTLSQLEEAGLCRQGQPPRLRLGSDKQRSMIFTAGKDLSDFNSSCSEEVFS
jgi:FkbM family methyltransferase